MNIIESIILLPFYLLGMALQLFCLVISPCLLLLAIYSIPIDILLYPFVKKKWKATIWVYEDLFMLIWDDTIRDIRELQDLMT